MDAIGRAYVMFSGHIQGYLALLCCVATCRTALECPVLFPGQAIMDRCVANHSSGSVSITQIVVELQLAPAQRTPVVYRTCAYEQQIHLCLYDRDTAPTTKTCETAILKRVLLLPP